MSTIEMLMVHASTLVCFLMTVTIGFDEVVAVPGIRSDRRTGFNMMKNKGLKGISGTVQGDVQTNATHSLFHLSSFYSNGNDRFAMGTAPSGAGFLAADEKFIDFYPPRQLFPVVADGAASELLQPTPGRLIAAEAQEFLKIDGIDTGFAGGEPPHGFKPIGDRFFGAVHDGTGRQ